uniref:Zinc finger, CCHC-type n=1 Tax=Tanacetum cinerariifolium TaxID=118510 RepID=A0A699J7J5_TANCI|nr:zinc finger, CCHC-type [Tanacetum cinerariifolium]
METILKAYGIWETIVAKDGVATNGKKENTSKAIIFQTLPQDILMQVAQYSTAKEVWDSIKVKNLRADLVQKARLQTLRSELETLRIKPNEKKFLSIVATIEQYQDLDEMSFEEAIGRLTAYEERITSQDTLETNDQDKLLMASSNNKSCGKWREQVRVKELKTKASSGVMNVVSMDTLRKNARNGNTIETSKKSLISSMTLTLNLHCFEDKSKRSVCDYGEEY